MRAFQSILDQAVKKSEDFIPMMGSESYQKYIMKMNIHLRRVYGSSDSEYFFDFLAFITGTTIVPWKYTFEMIVTGEQ